MKRILALVLSLVLVAFTVAVSAIAENDEAIIKIKVSNKSDLVKTREINYDSSKEDIAMILVIGQSNSTYGVGYKPELKDVAAGNFTQVSEVTSTPEKGTVFSSLTKKAITELTDENDVSTLIDSISFGGFSAALGKTWYEKTGQKVVLVQASVGSTCLHRWLPDQTGYTCNCGVYTQTHYQDAVKAFSESYEALKDQYNIVHTGYIWNQGENDENRSRYEETTIDTTAEYYDAYKTMHDSFMSELPLDFGSIAVVRSHFKSTSMHFTLAREAQYKLCNDLDNLCMASRVFETCTKNDMHNTSAGSSGIHALQKTYNRVGTDSANNMLEFIGELDAPKFTSVSVFNQDGKAAVRFNQEGDVFEGNNVFTSAQTVIPFVDSITNKNKVEFIAQDGVVDEYGNILASAFENYDSVRLECEFAQNVEMDEEIVTSTTTTAPVNYDFSLSPADAEFTISDSTFSKYASYSANGGKYFYVESAAAGQSATFTSKTSVPAGKYQVKLYMRTLEGSGRAVVNVSLNDAPAVSVNSNAPYEVYSEYVLYDSINVNGAFTLKMEATSAGKIYAGYVQFHKIGEYDGEEVVVPSSTQTSSTSSTTTTTTTTTTTKPPVVESDSYKWNLYTDKFTYNADHTMAKGNTTGVTSFLNTHYANDGTYFFSSNNIVGNSVTLTSKELVAPGIYSAKLYARASGSRAKIDVSINGVKVATNLYTGGLSGKDAYNVAFDLPEGTVTVTEASKIDLSIVVTDVSKSGNLYLNSIELTKIGDAEVEETSSTSTSTSTSTSSTSATEPSSSTPAVDATELEFRFWTADVELSENTMGVKFGTQEGYKNFYSSAVQAGTSVTVTTLEDVEPGVYDATIFARTLRGAGRATVNVEINGVLVGTIDSTTASGQKNYAYPVDSITITKAGPVVIKFTATTSGSLYMNSLKLVKTAYVAPQIDITMQQGAQVRFNAITGMRFKASVDAKTLDSYIALGYTVTMGTLIAPADFFDNYTDLTFDTTQSYLDVVTGGYYNNIEGTIAGSIAEIKEKNYGRNFIARSYVKLAKDGIETVCYATENDNSRSIKYLAQAVINDGSYANEEQLAWLNKWAAAAEFKK